MAYHQDFNHMLHPSFFLNLFYHKFWGFCNFFKDSISDGD
ncbi:hypothetical protein EUBHAL_01434 [Anaerobutyricum hallii DSM 3353]|uniref:Uncharacterized protein n=1 Tax=Anaerobutyricum hallii DSM 3353 TaxID=411469 RepID=C0EVJ6_9FIRM|nr:hypothetical protein EUBHAL_01434 [Anaerobutyricum hallii DSM 3353]